MFSYAPYENWLVSAYYEKDGIIRYHYEQRPKKRQKINQEVLKNILVISLLVLLALGLIVLLGGTLVFAL